MSNPSPALASLRNAAEQIARQRPVADWLQAARAAGWERFAETGFPGPRHERWKYTRLNALARREFALPDRAAAPEDASHSGEFSELAGNRLVFVNGQLHEPASRLNGDAGLRLSRLGNSMQDDDPVARSLLGEIAQSALHPFAALNSALLVDGASLDLAPGAHFEEPLYLVFISTRSGESLIANPRIVLNLGANSALTVIEHHLAHAGARNLTNVTIEGRIGDGARLNFNAIQDDTADDTLIRGLHLEQARDSHVIHNNICLGGKLNRYDLHSRLVGPGSHIEMRGLYLAGDRQHVDNHTLVEHCVPRTSSQQDYKGVLHGRGRAVFNGKVLIHEGAAGSEAHQSNRNLLLSSNAEVDTKPELEIYNDDVKCSHGATVGQLDQQALFYLQSRGISEKTARVMLTFAFAESVLQDLPQASVRRRIEERVIGMLPSSERIRTFV